MGNNKSIAINIIVNDKGFSNGIAKATNGLKGMQDRIHLVNREAETLKNIGYGILGVFATGQLVSYGSELIKIADQYSNVNARLKLVSDSSAELRNIQDELYKISQETGTDYANNAGAYAKLALNLDEVGVKSEEILKINELVNKSLLVNGSNTEMASAFMLQFTQAMGSGVLQGDEFRSMMENNGYFAAKLAKALDTDIDGLRKMSKAGELTTDVLRAAFPKMADEINAAFQKIPPTTERALTVLRNAFYKIIDDSNQAGKGTNRIADAIIELADTVDANREDIVNLFVGIIENIPSVISSIKSVASTINNLVSTSSQLSGMGGMELGIVGALLFRGKVGAAGIMATFFTLNNSLEKYGLNIGTLKTSSEGFAQSLQNMYDGLSGKRDFNTGEFTGGLEKMVADAKKSFGEIKRSSSDTFADVADAAEQSGDKSGKAYQEVTKEIEGQYRAMADKVKGILDEISGRENSLAAELREMSRAGMSELQAWQDLKAEADEYYQAAQQAAQAGNFDLAKQKADEAKAKYKELNGAVEENGQVVISQEQAKAAAMDGVKRAGDLAVQSLKGAAEETAKAAKVLNDQTGGALAKNLPEIARQFGEISGQAKGLTESAAEFNKAWSNAWDRATLGGKEAIAQLEKELKELTKDRHIKIYVEEIEKKAIGGVVHRLARGGKLPGYGGGDRVKALLEPGEFVIRKEAVSKYGLGYLQALNAMRLNDLNTVRARIGGLITSATSSSAGYQRFQQGGSVAANPPAETINVNLNFPVQGRPVPFKIGKEHVKEFLRQMGEMHRRSSS
jgi:tape measure domain-containing protein